MCKEGHAEIATEDERHFNIIFQGPRHTLKVTKKSATLFEKSVSKITLFEYFMGKTLKKVFSF